METLPQPAARAECGLCGMTVAPPVGQQRRCELCRGLEGLRTWARRLNDNPRARTGLADAVYSLSEQLYASFSGSRLGRTLRRA